jgi:hypothetical protein
MPGQAAQNLRLMSQKSRSNGFHVLSAFFRGAQTDFKKNGFFKNLCKKVCQQLFTIGGKEIACGHFYFMY